MICEHCHKELDDNYRFCTSCGKPTEIPSDNIAPAIEILPPVYPSYPAPAPAAEPRNAPDPPVKPKRHTGTIIFSVISILLIIAIVAGLLTNWFGFYGPGTKILLAARNTLTADDLTMQIDASVGNFDMDTFTVKASMDIDKRALTLTVTSENGDLILAIFEGYLIQPSSHNYDAIDIRSNLDRIFDSIEGSKETDWAKVIKAIDEGLYEQLDGVIDYDEVDRCLLSLLRKLNDTSWLEEVGGMSVEKTSSVTEYRFEPDLYRFLSGSLECFQDAFRSNGDYQDAVDGLDGYRSSLDTHDYQVDLLVDSGDLVGCGLVTTVNERDVVISIRFSQIGKTNIDESALERILSSATIQ